MKRFWALLCIMILMFTLSACGMNIGDRFTSYSATFTWLGLQDLLDQDSLSGVRASNLIPVIKARSILNPVIEETGMSLTYDQLYEMISMEFDRDTQIYTVCVTADEAQMAMDIAQALAEIAPARLEEVTGSSWLVVLDPPQLTTNTSLKNLFTQIKQ